MSDDQTYERHLEQRRAQNYASTRRWAPCSENTGMVGEFTLAQFFGADQDLRNRPWGDGGVDLIIEVDGNKWLEIDAKASPYGDWLRVDPAEHRQGVKPHRCYVLVKETGEREGLCVGWAMGGELMQVPLQRWPGGKNLVHAIHVNGAMRVGDDNGLGPRLHSMQELRVRYTGWWRHSGDLDARPSR